MTFLTHSTVRFGHVDAAGIVFYPRYLEMVNDALECFFESDVGVDFHALHIIRKIGVPTVKLDVEFSAPSRLGDKLAIAVKAERVGTSSLALQFRFSCQTEVRLTVRLVIVCIDLATGAARPWPDDLRAPLEAVRQSDAS